jgi:hypothetical protein
MGHSGNNGQKMPRPMYVRFAENQSRLQEQVGGIPQSVLDRARERPNGARIVPRSFVGSVSDSVSSGNG